MTAITGATDWPALTGSSKQITWATRLRTTAIANMATHLESRLDSQTADRIHAYWTTAAVRETSAAWWIDHRSILIKAINTYTLTADERATISTMAGGIK